MMPSLSTLRRKELDKCARCGQERPIGGAVCFDCIDEMAAAKQAIREQGLCIDCWHEPALAERRRCASCLSKRRASRHARYIARKTSGICVQCGKAPQWHGRTTCAHCWGKNNGL